MQQFLTCRRGWWLHYYRALQRRRELPSLPTIGTIYHSGLEKYYRDPDITPLEVLAGVIESRERLTERYPELTEQIAKDCELVQIMLEGYFDWVEETSADVGLEVVGVEEQVDVPLEGTPYILRGKMDARLRRELDSSLLQFEHKTVGNLTDLPRFAASNFQFLTYDLLAYLEAQRSGNPDIKTDGVLLNMARRVKRTKTAKPPFYSRYEVRHNVHELRSHWRHVVAIGGMIDVARKALDDGVDPHIVCPPTINRNHSWSCPCAPITTMFDDGSDVEQFLAEFYEPYDPWARYVEGDEDE